jgi:hypothetical protein
MQLLINVHNSTPECTAFLYCTKVHALDGTGLPHMAQKCEALKNARSVLAP